MTLITHTRRRFYVVMACVAALVAITGFSKRYFGAVAAGTLHAPAIVHVHGWITFAWLAFLIVQTVLVATGRTGLHKSLGLGGIALGTLLIFTATEIAIGLLAREMREGGPPHLREFFADLASWILLIAGLFATAIANVGRPEVHKRFMLAAAFMILTPAWARIIQLLDGDMSRLMRNDLAMLPADALVLVAIAYDWKTRGRPHPAWFWAFGAIVAVQAGALLVRATPFWIGATNWLASLAG